MNLSIKCMTQARFPLMLAITLLSATALADARQGEAIARQGNGGAAPACMACHGPKGEGNAATGYPRLAGLGKPYIIRQLQSFQQGSRSNPVMQPIAQALSLQQVNDVADYYAGLKTPVAPARANADAALLARGRKLATAGNWNKGMPACFACHGPNGAGVPPHFPPLASQNAAYIASQLVAWQTGARKNDPQGLMKAVADKLDKTDIRAVAAYLSTLNAK